MKSAPRAGTATRSDAERTWRRLVALVMETRGAWRRKVAEATGLPFSRVRALWRLEGEPRTLTDLGDAFTKVQFAHSLYTLDEVITLYMNLGAHIIGTAPIADHEVESTAQAVKKGLISVGTKVRQQQFT